MQDIKKIIGTNLKYIRHQNGLSQEKFYEKYKLSAKYFSSVERGEINIGVELLQELARVIGTTPQELITFDPKKVITKKRIDEKESH